eukprot:g15748.t1
MQAFGIGRLDGRPRRRRSAARRRIGAARLRSMWSTTFVPATKKNGLNALTNRGALSARLLTASSVNGQSGLRELIALVLDFDIVVSRSGWSGCDKSSRREF